MKRKRTISGNIEKHGRKWRWRRTINGQHVKVVLEATSEHEALEQALSLEKNPHLLISDLWTRELSLHIAELKKTQSLSESYAERRRTILSKAAVDMRIDSPSQLNQKRIEQWLSDVMARTNTTSTRNNYLIHLHQFTKWLHKNNKIYIDPASRINQIKHEFTPRNTFLTSAEIRQAIDEAKKTGDKELELILLLGFECGMRHGEISAAKATWVDLTHNTITIPAIEKDDSWSRKGQLGRKREVVIEMVKELRQWFLDNGVPEPFLLKPSQPWGKYIYRYDFKKKYLTHMRKCGHPDLTIHDMRRSFGSNRIIAGRSIEQVANWMGIHPNTAWKYYARFTPVTGEIEHGSAAHAEAQQTGGSSSPRKKESKKQKKKSPNKKNHWESLENSLKKLKKLHQSNLIDETEYKELKYETLQQISLGRNPPKSLP